MKIKGLGPNINIPVQVKKKTDTKPSENLDKLEISKEAQKLNEASNIKLDKIKKRISTDFYNNDFVINKLADNILKEIAKK